MPWCLMARPWCCSWLAESPWRWILPKQFDASFPLGKIARSIWTEPTILQIPQSNCDQVHNERIHIEGRWQTHDKVKLADLRTGLCVWGSVPFSMIFTMLHVWALSASKQTYFDILEYCEACLWLPRGISIDGCGMRTSLLRDFNSWLVARLATCGLTVRWFWRLAWCFPSSLWAWEDEILTVVWSCDWLLLLRWFSIHIFSHPHISQHKAQRIRDGYFFVGRWTRWKANFAKGNGKNV